MDEKNTTKPTKKPPRYSSNPNPITTMKIMGDSANWNEPNKKKGKQS